MSEHILRVEPVSRGRTVIARHRCWNSGMSVIAHRKCVGLCRIMSCIMSLPLYLRNFKSWRKTHERITDSQTNLDIGKDIAASYISPVPATTIGEVEVMKTYARYCRSYQDEKVTNPLTMIDRRCPIAVFVPSGFRILALEIPANCQAV